MPVFSMTLARRLLDELCRGGPHAHVDLCASDAQVAVNAYQMEQLIGYFEDADGSFEVALGARTDEDCGPGTYVWDPEYPDQTACRLAVSPLSEAPADAVLTLVAEGLTLPIRFRPCPSCGRKITVVERDAAEVLSDGFEVDDEQLVIKPHDCAGLN